MGRPTVAILGASVDRSKYVNKSLRAHVRAGFEVFPIHPHAAEVEGLTAYPSLDALPLDRLDRVSAYVRPEVLVGLLEQVARKRPGEFWLNPGTDSIEVVERAEELGLPVIRACSLIDASENPVGPGPGGLRGR